MKKISQLLIAISIVSLVACDVLENAASGIVTTTDGNEGGNPLTNDEVVKGLKEALKVGINNATDLTSKTDGFLKNPEIKIPFPPDAEKVRQKALDWGLEGQVDKIVTNLNRAAEEASKEAVPIFVNAITSMSISDGFKILNGGEGAATDYLRRTTTDQLKKAFEPKVKDAIEKVELTKHWNPVITRYNQAMSLTGGEKMNPDLNDYVTDKATVGLFTMVEKEENKIRKDPAARVNDILQKVFSSLDK